METTRATGNGSTCYRRPGFVLVGGIHGTRTSRYWRGELASVGEPNQGGFTCLGAPANFLDVGGGATKERVTEAFKIILSDDQVKGVLVNIFGGIVRCDLIAEGIIGAVEEVGVTVPVVVRLEGNNAELGSQKLAESGMNIIAAQSFDDAA